MERVKISENNEIKIVKSEKYNYVFNKINGEFARWGISKDDDPQSCIFGPEILDIEVSTKCSGIPNVDGIKVPCKFCYKENGPIGKNMSLETFKKVLDRVSKSGVLTQLAIGADAEGTSNPDLFAMMEYARFKGIIPNITVANVTDETADKLVSLCGAVAVSRYANKDVGYDTVRKLNQAFLRKKILVRKRIHKNELSK